ncbi:FAD-dependent oxidoreductase [Umezawaea endophytica]|uniref:FAD-dependent oxidoreductase n=1 Tax=Umezawaea endophytica TaxID=1654476 RepID=A0A9X2ZZ26_9PSEU|nr:FAD-dependent oxidoreductase [Umezawaea endophytica]MCS7476969.1 FAD-dependent oxidoreductase [Umezawaea endophytica]
MNLSRRTLLRGTALTGAAVALGGTANAAAAGQRVAVLGGGMAGLAAAHELVERGFDVTVYESTALGGKARSVAKPGTGTLGRADLPGEHGFRFFPGFYHNVPDTMSRIPLPGNGNSVSDNLVSLNGALVSRTGRADIELAIPTNPIARPLDPASLRDSLIGLVQQLAALPVTEVLLFVDRLLVFMTSSDARRAGQWENVSFWDFMRAENRSTEYQVALVRFMTRGLVALKERVANTRTVGSMLEAFVFSFLGRGTDGQSPARMLNGPTSETWIDPWAAYLTGKGVRFRIGQTVRSLGLSGGRIASATVTDASGSASQVTADWFICAVPVERAQGLLSADVLARAPELRGIGKLQTDWMSGVQFYLRETPSIQAGTQLFLDTPWEITSVLDSTLWDRNIPAQYGDGVTRDILSLDVSDWDTPGILYGKPARECTIEQVYAECWAQVRASLNDTGRDLLPDGIRYTQFLDPAIRETGSGLVNDTPLFINTVGSYRNRPESATSIPNLFMAGDYVRTDLNLATMEGANESGRQAVNALLDAASSTSGRVRIRTLHQPPELVPAKAVDAARYAVGLPNVLDLPG